MKINPDDPKWTAFVLGELDEPARAAIEAELANSAEARHMVEETRRAAELLQQNLAEEPLPEPSPELASALTNPVQAARENIPARPVRRPQRRSQAAPVNFWRLAFSAGGLALLALAAILFRPHPGPKPPPPAAVAALERLKVAEETKLSLACIGYTLLEAGNSTETILKQQTVPLLRNGLEKLKESLSKEI